MLSSRLVRGLSRKWFPNEQDGEDFFSFVMLKQVEKRKATLDQLRVDYIRRQCRKKRDARITTSQIYNEPFIETNIEKIDAKMIVEKLLKKLRREDRIIVKLYFFWGLRLTEIADCFGVSKGFIHQKLNNSLIQMREIKCRS